ncbi:MAG TPA: thioredoxin family protein [Candidatus Krumholzibacteria bacterium]|nr:thioredoxin family protein [Candidatus Krumholzibacteria bacterium]
MLTRRFPVAAALATALMLTVPAALKAADRADATAAIDKTAPDFSLTGIDGKTYKLSDFQGKYVVLEWNNFDCPFVKKHYGSGNMQALQKKYVDAGVVWLTICSSAPGKQGYYEPADLQTMTAERKLASTAYLRDPDGTVGREYGARTTPHMFVIDPKGVLVYAGAIDDKPSTSLDDIQGAHNYVRASLDAAMAGKPVADKSTTAYGCGVKYSN